MMSLMLFLFFNYFIRRKIHLLEFSIKEEKFREIHQIHKFISVKFHVLRKKGSRGTILSKLNERKLKANEVCSLCT